MSRVLEFYEGEIPNQEGLYLKDIMNFDSSELESNHSYIQWLFPLIEPSLAIPGSPILEEDDIEAFAPTWDSSEDLKATIKLRKNFLDAFEKMMSFYGLRVSHSVRLIKDPNSFSVKSENWITVRNHNFLRISRILASLILLNCENAANMFYECLCDIYEENKGIIGPLTKQFWDEAMEIKR